jgi:hypothetical protein
LRRHFRVRVLLYRGGLVSSTFKLLRRSWFRCHSQGPRFLRDRHFGPPMMGLGGCGGPISRYVLAVRATAGIRLETDSPHPSSLRGHRSTDRRNSGFLLVFYCAHLAMRRRHDERHKCASTDGRSCLLGRAERSSPKAAQRRATGAGLDGERADRAHPCGCDAHHHLTLTPPQLLPWSSETQCHPPTCDA